MEKNRIEYIDLMKGICIILVVLQHADLLPGATDGLFVRACKSFHMPMFFFVAGLFVPLGKSLPHVLVDRFSRLLVPWLVFAVAGGLVVDVCVRHNIHHLMQKRAVIDWFVTGPNVPLYFLRALFMSVVAAWMLARVLRTTEQRVCVLPVLCALSWAAMRVSPQVDGLSYYPKAAVDLFALRETAGMLMYLWEGMLVASLCTASRLNVGRMQGAVVFVVAVAALALLDPPVMRWHYMQTKGAWLHVTAAAECGIVAVWGLSCVLSGFRLLRLAGECSLAILVTHYVVLHGIAGYCHIEKETAGIVTLVLLAPVVCATRRWLPWACGLVPLAEWREGRMRPSGWLSARINRIKSGIAEYFL